jgi:hypothetical protein
VVDSDMLERADSVDEAINLVLTEERKARDDVDRCLAEAERMLDAAEDHARRIARRNEERIRTVHRIADQAVKRALDELEASPAGGAPPRGRGALDPRLDAAVRVLADEIIGGPS